MTEIDKALAAIGFARCRPVDGDWRTVRLERQTAATDPACSRAVLRWRDRLRRGRRPSPYRISRA